LSDESVNALAQALGIDAEEIERRKAFLEFGEADVRLLKELHQHLQRLPRRFADAFYAHLLAFDETRAFLPDAQTVERLKRTQAAYFDSLTAGQYGPDYVHHRLRVGIAHQRIGLEPKWYIGAYSKYLSGLLPTLWECLQGEPQQFLDTCRALQKLVLFDMGLAIDTYIQADRRAIVGLKRYAENIIASLPAGLVVIDTSLTVLSVNRSFRELFGLRNGDELAGKAVEDVLPVPGLRREIEAVRASGVALHGLDAEVGDKRLRLDISGIRLAEEEEEEEEDRLLLVIEDVTEAQTLRAEAQAHEQRFQDLVQGLDAIVWEGEAGEHGLRFTFVSERAEALLGYPVELWLTDPEFWVSRLHPEDRDTLVAFYRDIIADDGHAQETVDTDWGLQYRMRAADGREIWFHDAVRRVAGGEGGVVRLRGVMVDMSTRKEMEARLEYLAHYDALTGLPNRTFLFNRLEQAIVYGARHQRAAAVLFLDLDRFKIVNDSLGHSAGDQVLRDVAARLESCIRSGDMVARLGGDEFVVLLEDMASAQDATLVAQKLLDRFTLPFTVQDPEGGRQAYHFTTSIGISLYPDDGDDAHALLRNADTAMYRAKEQGGNNYQFFTAEMTARARRRMSLESALHRAIEQEQFLLHYQPQVELATGRVTAIEALLRWNHPQQGLIPPMDFIPVLEETGMILTAGEWVLRTACRQQRAWMEAGLPPVRVAVNLSARQLRHQKFVDSVFQIIADTGIEPAHLELEITESMVMQQVKEVHTMLNALGAAGMGIAMDDFGTGYSSLSYLKGLPIDTLKIDKSFVGDITADPDDAEIVATIIAMARSLKLKVIAEGVETREQLDFLCAHDCDAMQGYYFSKPLPADEIPGLLQGTVAPEFRCHP